ncbi:MAG: trigger factor [Thermomicrobiales bacterium]|nr:trigger factor [Thermomicrobiales bacterium]
MNVTVERIPESQVRLEIVADAAEQEQAIDKAIRKISRDIAVPGFRKGKAPRSMIERLYGREAFVEEANRDLIDELFRKAIEQEEIVPVGDPELDSVESDPLSFVVRVPVYPVIEPGDYLSVRADQVDAALGEGEVDELLADMQRAESPWVDPAEARKPKEGDQVTVDIEIKEGDEEFQPLNEDAQFIIGESNLLEELRTVIETLEPGGSGSADISFAEDDERYREDDPRRGKTMTYNVTLKGIKERELLPLDDEFASTYGKVDTLQALREQMRNNLHVRKTREARTEVVNAIVEKLHELADFDIPAAMVDDAVNERLNNVRQRLAYSGIPMEAYLRQSGQTEEDLKEELRPQSARDLRTSLILREIANRESIAVTDEDLDAEIDDLVSGAPEAEEMREAYSANAYLRSALRNDLYDQRLTDRLIEIATEGKGAVTNGFVPEAADEPDEEDEDSSTSSSTSDSDEEDEAGG